jgi:hypothetical protein
MCYIQYSIDDWISDSYFCIAIGAALGLCQTTLIAVALMKRKNERSLVYYSTHAISDD